MFLFAGWVSLAKANNYLCWSPVTPALPCCPANNNELRQQMAMNGRRGHLAVVMDYIMCNHAHCPLCHGDALFWSSSSTLDQSNVIPIFMASRLQYGLLNFWLPVMMIIIILVDVHMEEDVMWLWPGWITL